MVELDAQEPKRATDFKTWELSLRSTRDGLNRLLSRADIDELNFVALDALRNVIDLWLEIFTSDLARAAYVGAPKGVEPSSWFDSATLLHVGSSMRSVDEFLEHPVDNVDLAITATERLTEELFRVVRRGRTADFSYLDDSLRRRLSYEIESLGDRVELAQLRQGLRQMQNRAAEAVTNAEQSATVAESAADATKTAAGLTSDVKMSSFYLKLETNERRSANTFRWLTTFLALVAGGAALLFVMGAGAGIGWLDIASGDYVRLIQRAILVAGIFGLAGYFARQAHHHRSMANWAGSIAVQLQTFDAYLAAIDSSDVKDELRKSFAARAFGDHPAMKGEPTVTPSAAAMDTAVGWAAKLTAGGK